MPHFAVETIFKLNDQFSSKLGNIEKKTTGVGKIFKGVFGANVAMAGLQKLGSLAREIPDQLQAMAEKGEGIARTSKIIGLGTDELQRFRYAAKMTDTDVGGMEASLKKMNNGLAQLKKHQGPIETGLKRMNPQLMAQLRTAKDSQSAFLLVAEAMSKTENAQKRAAMAQAIFGKAGQDMIPMLLEGKAGLAKIMGETEKYAGIMGKDAIEASEKFADAQKKTNGVLQSLKNSAITPLLEAITPYLDKIVEWITQNKLLLKQKIKDFVTGFMGALKVAGQVLAWVIDMTTRFGPALLATAEAILVVIAVSKALKVAEAIFNGVKLAIFAFQAVTSGAATAMEALNLVLGLNPIGLVVIAVVALVALTIALIKHWNDASGVFVVVKKSIMSLISVALSPLLGIIDLVCRGLEAIGRIMGKDVSGIAAFRQGMEGFVYKNTFLSGMQNQFGPSKGMGGFRALEQGQGDDSGFGLAGVNLPKRPGLSLINKINIDNSRAPGVSSKTRVAPPIWADPEAVN